VSGASLLDSGGRSAIGYRPPAWLPGRHLQTIWPSLLAPKPLPAYHRERWDTPDGDFIDLDWALLDRHNAADKALGNSADTSARSAPRPLLALFHGLEGNSDSHYSRTLMAAANDRGCDGVVIHFRGCSGELNRMPRAYHSGDSDEADWVLRRISARRSQDG